MRTLNTIEPRRLPAVLVDFSDLETVDPADAKTDHQFYPGKSLLEARAKFDEVWHSQLTENQWPTDRWNYKRMPKPRFDALSR